MASTIEVQMVGIALRDQLHGFANNGDFSAAERDGFARLHFFFSIRLEQFFLAPANGSESPAYNAARDAASNAEMLGAACLPGNTNSQQPYYDAVHLAANELAAVTARPAKPLKRVPTS